MILVSIWLCGLDMPSKLFCTVILAVETLRAWQSQAQHATGTLSVTDEAIALDGNVLAQPEFVFRGAWVVLRWRALHGRKHVRVFWPGDLLAASRRELKQRCCHRVDAGHTPMLST